MLQISKYLIIKINIIKIKMLKNKFRIFIN